MTATDPAVPFDPYRLGRGGDGDPARSGSGPASKRVIVAYGFWIFLLSDIIMFSAFFASYAVLAERHRGWPDGPSDLRPPQRGGGNGLPSALEL